MTPEEREQFYDREIAPTLLELARKCQDNGLSMVAMVEWEPGETGRTACLAAGAGVGIGWPNWPCRLAATSTA